MANMFNPELDWKRAYETLCDLAAGKPLETGMEAPITALIIYGLVESREVEKPCQNCGKPQFDYRYNRITGAGRVFMKAAEQVIKITA